MGHFSLFYKTTDEAIIVMAFWDNRQDQTNPKALPLEEDYDVDPMDSYGLSKVVNEKTARSLSAWSESCNVGRSGGETRPNTFSVFKLT